MDKIFGRNKAEKNEKHAGAMYPVTSEEYKKIIRQRSESSLSMKNL